MQGIGSEHLLEERFSGKFRKCDVWIGERKGSDWVLIPTLIKSWCDLANNAKTEEEIQHDHIRYERIHPFGDYNGRSGRILMNWQRIKAGLPLLVIKESEKSEYYKWFK
jgi:Fic family protein